MAAFNLTAELNIRGPSNLNRVVADIRRQLSTVSLDLNINPNTSRGVQAVTRDVRDLSAALRQAQANAVALGTALRGIGGNFNNISSSVNNVSNSLGRISTQSNAVSVGVRAASSEMAEFGKQSALAIRRFAAFSVATGAVYALGRAVTSAYSEFVNFNKEFVRLQQVTESTKTGLTGLSSEITRLATNLGVSSSELLNVSVTLAQAGLSAGETKQALEALAKSALAPSFDSLNDTVEGSIALMRQFGIGAGELESALGSVNAVAARFAVEAGDIIAAIQRTGGVFAAASNGVSQGKDALNEFLAVFTSVRATTRESAETIATGLRTIFTRIQRTSTIDALKDFGITLTDLEGKFVGPFEAVRRLSEGLKTLDPRDLRFSQIVEELGGFRQIGKVIPLIQQFATAQEALSVAQKGSKSLAADAATAQESLAIRITKVREQFIALIRDIGQSSNFQAFADVSLKLASALISVADAAKDVLPALAAITAIRGVGALGQFFSGFSGGVGRRQPRGFASGGVVPGSGNRDTVPAMLTPGEFVVRKKAVEAIGSSNLYKLNGYNRGGRVKRFARGGMANAPMIDDILQTSGSILPRPSAIEQLIKAGGGAVDIDRTLKRTIGDKAYGKAPSVGSQQNVLARYFADQKQRLQDIQSAPLTAFGKSLQQAIKAGQLKGSNVSIISKSRRTQGVPEYLSSLFGIPVQNMIFTQGADKQPAVDAMRAKGPRASRVGRFNLGGIVQRFAQRAGGSYRSGSVKPLTPEQVKKLAELESLERENKLIYGSQIRQLQDLRAKQAATSVLEQQERKGNVRKISKDPMTFGLAALFGENYPSQPVTAPKSKQKVILKSGIMPNAESLKYQDVMLEGFKQTILKVGSKLAQTVGAKVDSSEGKLNDIIKNTGIGNIIGSALEGSLGVAGAPFVPKTRENQSIDFPSGIGAVSSVFGLPSSIPTDATRTSGGKGKTFNDFLGQVDRFLLKSKDPIKLAKGGDISGEDTVPALLTPGEFVINRKAAAKLGASRLSALNKADKIQGYNRGGVVQRLAGGGSILPARSTDPTNANTVAVGTAIASLREMASALEDLGVTASSSARLVEAGGAISISASERALQQDVNRLRIAGASATDIYRAEQRLGTVREQNANKLNAQQIMSGATGGTLQDIQTRAEAERERLLNERRTVMASRGRSAQEIEETLSNDTRYQDYVRRQSYETATTQVTGASGRMMRDAGVTGTDIEQYVNQSMMDRRTLAQMDAQLRQSREQELRNSAAYASASAAEQRRMLGELRARNNEEINERRNIVTQLARDRGMASGLGGQALRGVRTAGALFGIGTFAEDEGRPGGGLGGRLNRFSAGAQRAGFGLSLAGGMIGSTIGDAIGGKTGAGIGAATSAFASSVGVGAMFGPIGAFVGVITGATSAIKAWTDAVANATLAEEQSKTEQASIKVQKGFERLEKSTTRAETSGAIQDITDQLQTISGSFGRSGEAITNKNAPSTGFTGFLADLGVSAANILSESASKALNFAGARLGLNEDRAANFNGFTRQIDQNQLSKEIAALAKNSQVARDLPQLFEQGLRKGQTISQIEAKIGPDSLASLKEIFAASQGNEVITGLMAQRAAATQELSTASTDSERERLKQRIDNLNIVIRRIAEETFSKDIKKSIIDKITAERNLEAASASATIKINLFAEALKDISSAVEKAGVDFQSAQRQIAINLGSAFGDQIQMVGPDRSNENILENIRAYPLEAINRQIAKVGADFGFNPAITKEAQAAATNQKIIQAELPKILAEISAREKGGFDPEGSAAEIIKKQLGTILKGRVDDPKLIIDNIIKKITPKLQSRQGGGVTVSELLQDESALNEILAADTQTLEVFNNVIKQANDQIANMTAQFNRYSAALNQATELQIQKENIGIEGENQLNQALGRNLSLSDMNAAFENSISILTSRIGADGRPVKGTGTLDPAQIMQRMIDKEEEAARIQKQLDTEKPPIDSARFKELNTSLARTTAEARNLQEAHSKLASDSSRASNALSKISEIRQQNEARQSMFLEVLKNANNPEWQTGFVDSVNAYEAVMAGQNVDPMDWEKAVQGLEYKMRANPRDAQAIQEQFIQNASRVLENSNPELKNLLPTLLQDIGVGGISPEMQGLIDEFYRFNGIQQDAINQSAERIISAGARFLADVTKAGADWQATVGAGGQRNPMEVKPAKPAGAFARGGIVYAQDGGAMVNFNSRGTDTVPAMLTPGEFVVNRKAASKNMGLLKAINNGTRGYSKGGVVYLQDGGYVPKDTTIEEDARILQAEMDAAYKVFDDQLAELDTIINPLIEQNKAIPEGPQNDPLRRQVWDKLSPLYAQRDQLLQKRMDVGTQYRPKWDAINARRSLEKDRRIASTGQLSLTDQATMDFGDIPGQELGFRFLNPNFSIDQFTPEERKKYEEYQAEADRRKAARIQEAKDRVAKADGTTTPTPAQPATQELPSPLNRDYLIGGFGGPAEQNSTTSTVPVATPSADMTPQQRIAAKRQMAENAYIAGKAAKKAMFLANNPAYARQEERKQQRAAKEQQEALAWKKQQNAEAGFADSKINTQEAVKEYRQSQRAERAAEERLRLYGTRDKLTPEQAAEISELKRGEALARRFRWTADSASGTYEGGDRLDPPEVMRLPQADRDALVKYQQIQTDKLAKEEREKKAADRAAERKKSDDAFQARLDKERREKMLAFEEKEARKKQTEEERKATVKKEMEDENLASDQRLKAAREAQIAKEKEKLAQANTEREQKRTEEAIAIAKNNPGSADPARLSPEEQAEAKRLGIPLEKFAFDKSVDNFKSQLRDPAQIDAETESVAARLRDVISANNAEIARIEEEKKNQGWFSRLKEGITLSDPYSQISSNARQKVAAAESLLASLRQQQGLTKAERIELNNRTRNGYLTLIRNRPGEQKQFEEMMSVENNAIDLTRDAVLDVATSAIPAGAAAGAAAKATTKTASLALKAGQALRTGAMSSVVSGVATGGVKGGEEGTLQAVAAETAKGIAIGAASSVATPLAGAAIRKVGTNTGRALTAALPESITKTAQTVAQSVAEIPGRIAKKSAENDAMVEKKFQAWQKYETQRLAQEKAAKTANRSSARTNTAQSDWLKKNAPLATRSKEELEEAITRGQESAARFQAAGLEAPNFSTVSSPAAATTTAKTSSTSGSKRISLKQAIEEANASADDAVKKYGTGGEGKYGGSKRYSLDEDASPITAQNRKDAVKSVQEARTAAETRAVQQQAPKGNKRPFMPTLGPMFGAVGRGVRAASTADLLAPIKGAGALISKGSSKILSKFKKPDMVFSSQEEYLEYLDRVGSGKRYSRGGVVYASKGQLIPFVPKGTDTVPAMLTPGEFVINRAATQKHLPLLKAINNNQLPGYAKGGKVQRFQYGGMADQSGGGGGGVSNIGLDTSGLDAAFNSFATNVESLKSVMDSFVSAASAVSSGFSQLSQLESGASRIGTAAASISSAAQTFGGVIANFNSSISALQSAFSNIPSAVDFRVSGSVPINITVDVNGGDGLQESLSQFQDQIFTEISNGIRNAMPGVNISFTRTT